MVFEPLAMNLREVYYLMCTKQGHQVFDDIGEAVK